MDPHLKVLLIDAGTSYYRVNRYRVGDFFGPIDCGLHLSRKYNSLNFGTGLLAGSIFPGSSRLIFTGFSPCWSGFYISSMGGAGLIFNNLGIDMLSITGRCERPSILYLNRLHGEEIRLELVPLDLSAVWNQGRRGVYSLMDYTQELLAGEYTTDPRILAVGPAALSTDFGAIASTPLQKGKPTGADTWAGRGGFGSKMLQEHGIAAVIYGGTHVDEDFRDRRVADEWFKNRYQKRLAAKDLEATTKYRYDEKFDTGGTFGVNYTTLAGSMLSFNYKSLYMTEEERLDIHEKFIIEHYLKQFNEETIDKKQQKTCGEPCAAVCKKMNGEFKKDYEPYQTMGPLAGVFDQRAAERLVSRADTLGFDAISAGGVISWLMESLDEGLITPEETGTRGLPVFSPKGFDVVRDSAHNADIGMDLLNAVAAQKGILNLSKGARKFARHLARDRGRKAMDSFVYNANARNGWVVPNQYWTPGALSPMAIMGKYYMYYGKDFLSPRELGREDAAHFQQELILDNSGLCRFHRKWGTEMLPDIIGSLYGLKDEFLQRVSKSATRINARNASIFWETERNIDFIYTFLKRKQVVEGEKDKELIKWIEFFERDRKEAALAFWYETHKGITESLKEF